MCRTCRRAWAQTPDNVAERVSKQVGLLRPNGTGWVLLLGIAGLSWACDYASLVATGNALDAPISSSGLVLGFLVVQGSIALQVFPGGAGLAEAGLLATLVAAGTPLASATAVVVVYRLINWLGLAALGWVVYGVQIHIAPRDQHQCAPESTISGH